MKQIIVVKPKSLTPEIKKELKQGGLLVIEHENPNEVRVLDVFDSISGNDIVKGMRKALMSHHTSSTLKSMLADHILETMKSKEKSA